MTQAPSRGRERGGNENARRPPSGDEIETDQNVLVVGAPVFEPVALQPGVGALLRSAQAVLEPAPPCRTVGLVGACPRGSCPDRMGRSARVGARLALIRSTSTKELALTAVGSARARAALAVS